MLVSFHQKPLIDKDSLSINYDENKLNLFFDLDFLKSQRKKIGDENFCAVVQDYLEDTIVEYLNHVHEKYPVENLCLSGGVSANIIMSLNIYERTKIKNIFVY